MWKKIDSPSGEGSPIVTRYNYATGEYIRPSQYGENMRVQNMHNLSGLDTEIDTWNTRMGIKGTSPMRNYMIGNGNSPMDRGGANLFPSPISNFEYLTTGGYPPPSAMPQNANIYPAMFDHQTGQRIDPQSFSSGLVKPVFIDKHSASNYEIEEPMFDGLPEYLRPKKSQNYGSAMAYRDVNGSGGYKYRQFADGSIQILASSRGGVGTMVYQSSPYWQAITKEIGTYSQPKQQIQLQSQTAQNLLNKGQEFAQSEEGKSIITSLFDRFVSTQSAKTEQQKLLAQQAQSEQQRIAQDMQPSAFQKSLPYLIAVGMIIGVGTVVFIATKPKK